VKARPKVFVVDIAEAVWMRDEGWMGEHVREIHEWTITIEGTRYNCVIRECPCGLRRQTGVVYVPVPMDAPDWATRTREVERVYSVLLTNCTCKSEAHRGPKPSERDRVCHGWHRARVDKVFSEIARPQKIKTSLRSYGLAGAR
jgi:hypothetical protein